MSAYANDSRVKDLGDGSYRVTECAGGANGEVTPALYGGYVGGILGEEWPGLGFDTADDAIRSLIGEPQ